MTTLHPDNVTKPIDDMSIHQLPDAKPEHAAAGLEAVVEHSTLHANLANGIHASAHSLSHIPLLKKLVPGLEELAAQYHIGNYVMIRGGDKFFESMPIYARLGMHLLFYGKGQVELLETKKVEGLLREQSEKQGVLFDAPSSVKSIESFVKTYALQTDELLQPDLTKYGNFNEFFYRKLKEDARPVQNAEDPAGICSAADCRLTVYQTVDLAKHFWVKGRHFNIPNLLGVAADSEQAKVFDGSSLAIFRLAPADYHRFHSPIDGEIGDIVHIPGQYYTVNPQAVNEAAFDVFTANTRSVLYMKHTKTGLPVAFIAVGALLVGSIKFTNGGNKGSTVKRGEELGYFAYGGSTVITVFPQGIVKFDEDLTKNSTGNPPIETLMKVGYSLGVTPAQGGLTSKWRPRGSVTIGASVQNFLKGVGLKKK